MTSARIILAACIIFCLPLGLVAMAQVWQLQPTYASEPIKVALTLFAAINWAAGLAWGFYLRARWGDTIPLLGVGGLAVAVFYTAYYSGQPIPSIPIGPYILPFGLVFGVLTSAFDLMVLERSLHCLGMVTKQTEQVEQSAMQTAMQNAEHKRQMEAGKQKIETIRAETTLERVKAKQLPIEDSRPSNVVAFPMQDAKYQCLLCNKSYATVPAYAAHRRHCMAKASRAVI